MQVKYLGYRIELGDIENQLIFIDDVDECAVIFREINDFASEIVAFVVSKSFDPEFIGFIKNSLSLRLPSYMVPKKIVILERLPRSPNGKIDRGILKRSK